MLGFIKSFSSNIHYKYSVQSRPSFEAGCWTVYDAKHKTTGDPVSVFVFSKKVATEVLANNGMRPRSAVLAEVWEFATRGVQQLTKIRHPAVLKLVEPLESTKSSMTFVTERVIGSVDSIHESDLDELSVVRGLTTVVQALQFLHSQLGVVHTHICPQTVFADLQGDWKIAGLEFVVNFEEFTTGSYHLPLLDPRMPSYMHPSYDYLAPELVLNKTVLPANDVWSLACLLYTIYLRRSPLHTRNNPSGYKEELDRFRSKLNTPSTTSKFPVNLQPYLASLFCEAPEGRMTLAVLETTDFFQNPLIKALKSMDEYPAKPVEEKVSFLKHFQTLLPQFPKQMRIRKIVKFATRELSGPRDPSTGLLLGNVLFAVCTDMSRLSFQETVLPIFSKLTDYFPFQESVSNNLEVIAHNTNDKDFSKSVLPSIIEALKYHDAQHVPVQIQVLSKTDAYAGNVTISKLEETLFPSVIDCFAATPARPVKIAATESLGVLVHRGVSKSLITDRLIPALQAMKTRDPAVVLAVAKLWNEVCARLQPQQIFTLALPHLLELSLAKQLTVEQFKQFMKIVRDQINGVEKEQLKTLVHNQPNEEDDWLNEPATVRPASSKPKTETLPAANPPTIPSPDNGPSLFDSASFSTSSPALKPGNTSPGISSGMSLSSSKPSAAQRSQKLPELPPPKISPPGSSSSQAMKPQALNSQALNSQPMKPQAMNSQAMKPQSKQQSTIMPPLIPSSNSNTSSPAPGDLFAFTPLQPEKPRKTDASSSNDEFGSFMSSSSTTTTTGNTNSSSKNNFDSLI